MVEVETTGEGASGAHVRRRNDVDNNGERTSGRGARSGNAILITFFISPRLSPDAVSLEREEIAAQCNPSAAKAYFLFSCVAFKKYGE